ncbi:conserved unknown protein [Ectocarpus siliculosus]|uniref:Ubiquitin-like domain-containing protein n=1 Tax=Ectocarpus siliculosus TaxID=2880 RepID=D8LJ71_ECTSI|nr:conserved unknown protein [Ectocarpus siliculosus]|eukprot:CBN76955.1 conserved unknown protein [Ectocarpus siliculosus]
MLPRRGYEPVDDVDEDSAPDLQAAAASERDDDHHVQGELSALCSSVPAAAAAAGGKGNSSDGVNSRTAGAGEVRSDDDDDDGRMTVRVLDVRGQFYPLRVTPETSVRELKLMLVDAAGVEVPRQRIIHGGKMLSDADTLGGRKISDGAAIHLFQRPKVAAAAAAGVGTASAQQPGNLHEFPPVLLQVQERGGNGEGAGAHWEVEAPRRKIMFLASILVLISVLQLLECLASISTVLSVPGAAGGSTGGGNGGSAHPSLPGEYWFLVKGRTLSSVMGIVVGTLGVRGSQSLNTHTIRWYFVGLVMCAIVAMAIRIEVFYDIVTGKIPFGDYGINSPDSSRENDPGEGGGGGGGGGNGTGDEGGPGAHHETAEAAQSSLFFMAFSAFVSVSPARGRSGPGRLFFDVVVVPPRMKRKVVAPLRTGCQKRV